MSSPADLRCKLCGRGPAAQLTLHRHVGMVLAQRHGKFQGPLCREHGVGMAKAFLSKTLVQGWWGIVSFFMNLYAVAVDVASLLKARRLPPPSGAVAQPDPASGG